MIKHEFSQNIIVINDVLIKKTEVKKFRICEDTTYLKDLECSKTIEINGLAISDYQLEILKLFLAT